MEESARYELAPIEAFSMSTKTHFGRRKRGHGPLPTTKGTGATPKGRHRTFEEVLR
jgi:hypothetical protein